MAHVISSGAALPQTSDGSTKTGPVLSFLSFLFIALCVAFSIHQQNPPDAASSAAPAEAFSAGRAVRHLVTIAAEPHPMGSSGHTAVRDYIIKELSAAGLEPELQKTIGISRTGRPLRIGAVENILARLKGTVEGKSVLLVAHYDSMPNSFGASDDGLGVAALLETLRALRTESAPKNDIVFLFSDGEENGLLGANAFLDEHPWAKNVGVVLNFDARGNTGPAIMFETSDNNGWLIRQFGKVAPFPIAHSLSYEIYKLLPNDTDFTVFKNAGIQGLNFANINGISHYHTPLDNLSQIDLSSLQHHGSYALNLARHLGNLDLAQTRQGNVIYFDVIGRLLVRYSIVWGILLAVFVSVLFVVLMIAGLKRGRITLRGMAVGFLALLFSVLISSLVTMLLWRGVWLLGGGSGPPPDATQGVLFLISFVVLAFAVTSLIYLLVLKKAHVQSLIAGSLLWWLILMVLTILYLPGASFVFAWPLCFSLFGLGLIVMTSGRGKAPVSLNAFIAASICVVPGIILFVPVVNQVFVGLTLNWVGVIIAMVVLLLGLLIPHLQLINATLRWWLPAGSALLSLILLIAAMLTYTGTIRHPRPNSLFYAMNTDTGKALWASDDGRTDEWTGKFLSAGVEHGPLPDFFTANSSKLFLKGPAPAVNLLAPQLELIEDHTADGFRTIRLRLSSQRQATLLSVYLDSKAEVLRASVNEKSIEDQNDRSTAAIERRRQWGVRFYGFPPEGAELQLTIRAAGPLKIRLVDQSYGLPQIGGHAVQPRPQSLVASPAPYTDTTSLSRSFVL